jgi:ParB-like chromosome segregation protein Spo0J
VVLGGNMRLRACHDLGMKEIPAAWVQRVEGWPDDKKRRFIILDNRGFGEDDMEALANEWEIEELVAAGFTEAELSVLDIQPEKESKQKADAPRAVLTFPARVWLTQRAEVIAALAPVVESFGGQAEWPE